MEAARRYLAELLGTALLVVGGVGTAVLAPKAGPVGIALAFGLVLLVLAYAIGPVSGCHVNPAVTLGVTLAGRLSVKDAVGYVVSQVVGAVAGAAIVFAVASNRTGYDKATDGIGANGWGAASSGGYGQTAAVVVEIVLTFLLVYTVLTVTASKVNAATAGLPIGFALVVCHLVAVPIDGTSVNPARSLGPALFAGGSALSQLWVFIVFPLVGALLAVAAFKFLPAPFLAADEGTNAERTAEAAARHQDSTATPATDHRTAAAASTR